LVTVDLRATVPLELSAKIFLSKSVILSEGGVLRTAVLFLTTNKASYKSSVILSEGERGVSFST